MDVDRGDRAGGDRHSRRMRQAGRDRCENEDAEQDRGPPAGSGSPHPAPRDHRLPRQQQQDRDAAHGMHDQRPPRRRSGKGECQPSGDEGRREQGEQGEVGSRPEPGHLLQINTTGGRSPATALRPAAAIPTATTPTATRPTVTTPRAMAPRLTTPTANSPTETGPIATTPTATTPTATLPTATTATTRVRLCSETATIGMPRHSAADRNSIPHLDTAGGNAASPPGRARQLTGVVPPVPALRFDPGVDPFRVSISERPPRVPDREA